MIFALAILLGLAAYAIGSGVLPLHCSWILKLVLAAIVLGGALKFVVEMVNGGTLAVPGISKSGQIFYEAYFGAFAFYVFLLLVKDIVSLIFWIVRKFGVDISFSLNNNALLATIGVLAVLGGIYGCWQALKVPDVREETVHIKNLPKAWQGTKIAILADLHVGPIQDSKWTSEIVERTNKANPDIVLIAGDFVDGPVSRMFSAIEPIKNLKAKYGVYGIPGNHEYYNGYYSWLRAYRELGVTMLENQSVVLNKDGDELVIGGTTDLAAGRFGHMQPPDIPKTFAGTPANAPKILLTHQPKAGIGSETYFDLQVSGHTHGGHTFYLYPIIWLVNDGLVAGLYNRGDAQVYVSRGSGLWNGYSQRIGIPSEITVMTLEN